MIHKKVCMLGGFAVGKTSLVARYVTSLFSEKYLTTVGVKIDKKQVAVDGQDVTLMLWDVYGQDEFQSVQASQLRGMAGYLLVVDGTRRATLETARKLQEMATAAVGPVPFILLLNKADLASEWDIDEQVFFKLAEQGWRVIRTSAKTGEGVEDLLKAVIDQVPPPTGETDAALRALVFDSMFDRYRGVITYVRVKEGELPSGSRIRLMATATESDAEEAGVMAPEPLPEIGRASCRERV